VTYERRYSLLGATGTSGDVDDDAEHAMMRDEPVSEVVPAPVERDSSVEMFAAKIGAAGDLAELQKVWHAVNEAHLTQIKVTILETLKNSAKERLQ
jgi:hypothetical protein